VIVVVLLVVFLTMISLEIPIVIFLVTYARETLINEWNTLCPERSEGLHSLGWASQEEESWLKS